jgi:hypothetical protein
MMAIYEDPIVREVHETRAKLLAKYGGSEGYAQHLRELEAQLGDRIVTREPRKPAKVAKKVS